MTVQPAVVAPTVVPSATDNSRNWRGIKPPPIPEFNGNAESSCPKVVLAWLRQVKLITLSQNIQNAVPIMVTFLKGVAAEWRDTVFYPEAIAKFGTVIPWQVFEDALRDRFMSRLSCMDALEQFKNIRIRAGQSVEVFNAICNQRLRDLQTLPYISVPDRSSLVGYYLDGLVTQSVLHKEVQTGAASTMLHDLEY